MSKSRAKLRAGVIGLGAIGSGVANCLLAAGADLEVCDVNKDALSEFLTRASVAPNPAAMGTTCSIVVVAVVNDDQLKGVLIGPDGYLGSARPGSTVIILSTVSVSTIADVAETALGKGVELIDCGVSGGPHAAKSGSLVAMAGGSVTAIESVRPIMECFADSIIHMGPLGSGIKAKLARNLIQYGSWLAAFEGQKIAQAAGIELPKLAQAVRESDSKIGGVSTLMFRDTVEPLGDNDDPGLIAAMQSGAGLARKDLKAVLELAGELGIDTPLGKLALGQCDAIFGVAG